MNRHKSTADTAATFAAARRLPNSTADTHYVIETVIDARTRTIIGMNLRSVPVSEVFSTPAPIRPTEEE